MAKEGLPLLDRLSLATLIHVNAIFASLECNSSSIIIRNAKIHLRSHEGRIIHKQIFCHEQGQTNKAG